MKSVMDMARNALTGDTVGRMSSLLHESESGTRQAFEEALPVSVAGLATQASTEEGARNLLQTFKEGRYSHVDPEALGQTVADPQAAERVVSSSEGLMSRIFGNKLGGIVDGLAGDSGVSRSSASKLLGLAMPLVMGLVGKQAVSRNLDPRGLSGFLGEQARLATGNMSGRLAGMFSMAPAYAGGVGGTITEGHRERRVAITHAGRRRSIMPLLLAGLAALAAILYISNRRRERTAERPVATAPVERTAPAVPTPAAPAVPVPTAARDLQRLAAGSAAPLSRAIEVDGTLPARFVLSDLTFTEDSAAIEPASASVLDDVARVLQAQPTARIRVEGHTDATGDQAANLALSQERADSVKAYLLGKGITADRIETIGRGSLAPVASNDNPAGRAENRRTELVLTER